MNAKPAVTVRQIGADRAADLLLPNEPFRVFGKVEVARAGGAWTYATRLLPPEKAFEMRFPDERYDYAALCADHAFLGAYAGERCVGLSVLRDACFRHMYVEDLKVCAAYRRRGAATLLIAAALETARARGYRGLSLTVQDDNLGAFLFYRSAGFEIGGFDDRIYRGSPQVGKGDITMYLEDESDE